MGCPVRWFLIISVLPRLVFFAVLAGPILIGLAGTMLPAFGYLPALGAFEPSLAPFRDLFSAPGIYRSMALSLGVGLASTALSVVIVLGFTAGWSGTPSFRLVRRLLSPLLAVPHAAAAFGLAFLIGPSGFLIRLFSPWATGFERPPDVLLLNDPYGLAMVAGLVMKEIPFILLMTLAVLPQTNSQAVSGITATLGYGRIFGFVLGLGPALYQRLRLPVLAVLAYSSSVVDMAQILGPTTPAPLAPRIVEWMSDPEPQVRLMASAGALVQLLLTAAAILMWLGLERIMSLVIQLGVRSGRRHQTDGLARHMLATLMGLSTVLLVCGLMLLPLWSVAKSWWYPDALPSKLSFKLWQDIDTTAGAPLATSLAIGLLATTVSALLAIWYLDGLARRAPNLQVAKSPNMLSALIFLPLVIPQVSFLFGLQVLVTGLGLEGSLAIVAATHVIFTLPYLYLSLEGPWLRLDPRYIAVATSLGASSWKVFLKVRLPLLLQPILVAAAVGFAVSIGQYLPTLMMGAGRVSTITTESVALASGGNRSLIGLFGTLQLMLPWAGFALASLIPALVFQRRLQMRPC